MSDQNPVEKRDKPVFWRDSRLPLQSGFAFQAHFQRAFKKHLAATPGQYKP